MVAIPDDSIDVVISNGGFCLVPNKRRAFQEIRRVLKPKGRFSISCTTLKSGYGSINKFMSDEITEGDFPSCMEVSLFFIHFFILDLPLKNIDQLPILTYIYSLVHAHGTLFFSLLFIYIYIYIYHRSLCQLMLLCHYCLILVLKMLL